MRFIGKLLITILMLFFLIIILGYIVMQTRWGAHQVVYWINNHTSYHLSLGQIEHSFSTFDTIILQDVVLSKDEIPTFLTAKRLYLTLGLHQFTRPYDFNRIHLENGVLSLTQVPITSAFPLTAKNLQLTNIQIVQQQGKWPFEAMRVYGSIFPWQPSSQQPLGDNAHFQFSANQLTLNTLSAHHLLIEGSLKQQQLTINNFGADIAQGQITGSLQSQAGRWYVTQLNLSNLHWQTTQSLSQFITPMKSLPPLDLKQVNITNAKFEGSDWAVNNLSASLQGISWEDGQWQSKKGSLSLNADDIVLNQWHWITPILNTALSPLGIQIQQFSTRWENGLISTTGLWRCGDQSLQLDNLSITGVEYTLPQNWRELRQTPLPSWLNTVTISNFNAIHNLIIDINPLFPFQFTGLNGFGQKLVLAKNHLWGLYSGNTTLNASNATLNKTDLNRVSITLQADENQIKISDLSALSQQGVLEASATLQQNNHQLALTVEGKSVSANLLHQWGWPALPITLPVNMTLSLQGILDPQVPFSSRANATLHVQESNGQYTTQNMVNGVITTTAPQ